MIDRMTMRALLSGLALLAALLEAAIPSAKGRLSLLPTLAS
ncbi:hypothetical protein [Rhizobium lentis]|nr:hypothetical protein [Rhizobium lentis]